MDILKKWDYEYNKESIAATFFENWLYEIEKNTWEDDFGNSIDAYIWPEINKLEVFEKTEHNLIRMVIPPANGSKLCKYLENNHNYFIDWCGSLFWIEVNSKKEEKIKDLKKMANDFGGYLTVLKTSSEYDYGEPIFTVDKVRLMISEKVKQSFDPKRILNPGKMYRGV